MGQLNLLSLLSSKFDWLTMKTKGETLSNYSGLSFFFLIPTPMDKTYSSYASIISVNSLNFGDTITFKNSKLSLRVGTGGNHFISSGPEAQSQFIAFLNRMRFTSLNSTSVIFCNILGIPLTPMDIFTGEGFVSFTFCKLVKHLMMLDESLACNWHYSDNPLSLSTTNVSYGDVICIKKKDGEYIRLRVSNHHFINLDNPDQKQLVFEYLGINTPMALARDIYGYRPLNEGTGNFPHYKKNDWKAATNMAIQLIVAARDKIKNTGELEVKTLTSPENPCGEIMLKPQELVKVMPLSPPSGILSYLDFTYNTHTLRSRPKITKSPYWNIGPIDFTFRATLTRPRVKVEPPSDNSSRIKRSSDVGDSQIKVSKNRFATKIS